MILAKKCVLACFKLELLGLDLLVQSRNIFKLKLLQLQRLRGINGDELFDLLVLPYAEHSVLILLINKLKL